MKSLRTPTVLCTLLMTAACPAQLSEDVVAKVERGTVRIFTIGGEDGPSSGSGFLLNKEGHIGTNNHVVSGAKVLLVMHLHGEEVEVRRATLLTADAGRDMAIIKINPIAETTPLALGTADLTKAMLVWSVGFPGVLDTEESIRKLLGEELFAQNPGLSDVEIARLLVEGNMDRVIRGTGARAACDPTIFSGEIGKIMRTVWAEIMPEARQRPRVELLIAVHSAIISGGNSGGPLVNADGNVVGINTAGNSQVYHSSFIEEFVRFARIHHVPVTVVTTAPARAGSGLSTTHIAIIVISAVLAILAATLAIIRRKAVAESFTQYLRRGGNVTRLRGLLRGGGGADESRQRLRPQREVSIPQREPDSSATEREVSRPRTHAESFVLEGSTLDGHPVHLSFSGEMVDRSGGRLMIGRKRDLVHLWLDDASLSRQHAVIVRRGESLYLEDRESGNGTSVNGEKLGRELVAIKLKSGDRVQLGSVALTLRRTG